MVRNNDMGEAGPVSTRQEMDDAGLSSQEENLLNQHGITIEEVQKSDTDNNSGSRSNILQPDEILTAESEQDQPQHHVDKKTTVISGFGSLGEMPDTSDDSEADDIMYHNTMREARAHQRLLRVGMGSYGKRTMSERSDSDNEDLPGSFCVDYDQSGSKTRRLRRRFADRPSLAFEDSPPRIDEMDELLPSDLENSSLAKELPYFALNTMEEDSPSTSTFDISGMPSDLRQSAEGSASIPEDKDRSQANSMLVTKPGLPRMNETKENARLAEDEKRTRGDRSFCVDDTMSVQSYNDSIFDSGSIGSSMSSVYSDTQALVGEYVDFLVRDRGLEKLFIRSMSPTVLGPERFRRNYNKILQSFARDLKRRPISENDTKAPLYTQGLSFISRRSITMKVSSLIASRYMEKAPRTQISSGRINDGGPGMSSERLDQQVESEDEPSSCDYSPEDDPHHIFMISELASYFREGEPYQRMKRNLRSLVIPSALLSRVRSTTERMLDLLLCDEYLKFLLFKALSDPLTSLRDDQFDPKRVISNFGSRLKAEACSPVHLRVAEFLDTYSGYIATRAVQRMHSMNMDAILQQSQSSKFIDRDTVKITIRDNTRFQTPQTYKERVKRSKLTLCRAEEDSNSRNGPRIGLGFINKFGPALINAIVIAPMVLLVHMLRNERILPWMSIFGLATYMFVLFTISIAVPLKVLCVCLSWPELDAMIATLLSLLWCCKTTSEGPPEQSDDAFRYFAPKWSIGNLKDGEDIRQKLQSHLWHPYRQYLSSSSEEVLETIIDDILPNIFDADIDTHWPFIASSKIFKQYFNALRDAAVPTFFSESMKLVNQGLMDDDEDPNVTANKPGLLRTLEELQWCSTQTGVVPTIHISSTERSLKDFRVSNMIKLAVEANSRSEWQWWPLQPPTARKRFVDIESRISWICDCGTEREEIVPSIYASKLSHLASHYPLSNEPPQRPPSSLSNSSSQATESTSGSEGQSTYSGVSSSSGSSSLNSGTAATSPSTSVVSFGSPRKAFVFLVVKAGNYTLAPIDVTEKKARDFFQAITEKYNQKRKWRRLFSIYVYSHCDFVKIRRYAPQSFDPGFRFSFPPHDESPHDKEYSYYPRPMPHAPVSRHMFNHLFHACYGEESLAHKLHCAFVARSCIIKTIPGKLLDGMPKRDRLVDEEAEFSEDQDVEVFWGLVAREQRSAFRVIVYILLSFTPSLWFMFQWLFGWGHDGDLQDATVPLMFSTTMLGILWAVVYSGSDIREAEQPL